MPVPVGSSTRSTAAPASCPRCPSSRPRSGTASWRSPRRRSPTTGPTGGTTFTRRFPSPAAESSFGLPGNLVPPGITPRTSTWSLTPGRRSARAPIRRRACAWRCCSSSPMRGTPRVPSPTGAPAPACWPSPVRSWGSGPSSRVTTSPLRSRRRRRAPRRTGFTWISSGLIFGATRHRRHPRSRPTSRPGCFARSPSASKAGPSASCAPGCSPQRSTR
jgi:hypothetical protein